jgi:hypothetical protein
LGVFKQFGGIRRTITICHELATNMAYLKNGGWEATEERLEHVRLARTAAAEREAALFLSRHFRGLGPKQSRNCSSGRGCPATRSRSTAASSAG